MRHAPLAIYGQGRTGLGLALELTAWSKDLVLCTNGPPKLSPDNMKRLTRHGIRLRPEPIARLEGSDGVLERVRCSRLATPFRGRRCSSARVSGSSPVYQPNWVVTSRATALYEQANTKRQTFLGCMWPETRPARRSCR